MMRHVLRSVGSTDSSNNNNNETNHNHNNVTQSSSTPPTSLNILSRRDAATALGDVEEGKQLLNGDPSSSSHLSAATTTTGLTKKTTVTEKLSIAQPLSPPPPPISRGGLMISPTSSSNNNNNNETSSSNSNNTTTTSKNNVLFDACFSGNSEFVKHSIKFAVCFCGLQASYLTWGYMQELIMTTEFKPTANVPSGRFPSAGFCVFSNRFLALLVAMVAVRIKHGAIFTNNKAPLWAFTPGALSNTVSSWAQYEALKHVSFPVQTVFKSSSIIPVMVMGRLLRGTTYSPAEYVEALLITVGVAIFSVLSKSSDGDSNTELLGYFLLLLYIASDSFTSQWHDKVYTQYGRANVDAFQMMMGVNISAICITSAGLLANGDFPLVWEFIKTNPAALRYNIIIAITAASGQLCIFYTIREFGPIVFTICMTTRQMFSICISAVVFKHVISSKAASGAVLVFAVLAAQIYRKYVARHSKKQIPELATTSTRGDNGGGSSKS